LVSSIVISFGGIIFEDNSIRNFSGFFYKYGFRVYKKIIPVGDFNILPGEKHVITKEEGVFHFTDEGIIYFRSGKSKFRMFRFHTPLAFKAMGSINNVNSIEISARLPLFFSILSVSLVLLGIILSPLFGMTALFFALFPFAIFLISYPVEKNRMEKMVIELKEILAEHSQRPVNF
jgi:hypothetical protein